MIMETFISACGLICSKCDAYCATKENDLTKLELVAADWRKRYGTDAISAEDVRCHGCMKEDGSKCCYCDSMCGVRQCVVKKGFSTCAQCGSFPCEQLTELYGFMGDQGVATRDLLLSLRFAEKAMHSIF